MLKTEQWRRVFLFSAALLVFGGCAANRELQDRIAQETAGLSPAVEDDQEVARLGAAVVNREEVKPGSVDLSDDAGFEEFVAAALQRNPGILRAVRSVELLGYRVPQVTSLEDPIISLLPPTGDMTQTAAGMMDGSIGISQLIPFPSKLWARGRLAENEVRMAFAALADVRIATVAQVARAYYDYDLAQVSIDITRDSQRLLHQIRDVASARYRAGAATQQDVLRAEVELYSLTNDLITLEQQRATARAKLNTLMDRPVEAELPAPKPFELETVEWKLPEALDRAADSNPQLGRLREQVHRDLEAVKLAHLGYYPDLRVGFSYTFIGSGISPVANGDDNWSIPLGLTLPIWWQRLRAKVLEANAQTLASIEQFREMRNMVAFGVQDALVKIDTQYRRAVLYRELIMPRAQQAVEVSTAAYRAGQIEFTALIDNWRNWLNAALSYHRALAQLEQNFADLQQIVGVRIPRHAPDANAGDPVDGVTARDAQGGEQQGH